MPEYYRVGDRDLLGGGGDSPVPAPDARPDGETLVTELGQLQYAADFLRGIGVKRIIVGDEPDEPQDGDLVIPLAEDTVLGPYRETLEDLGDVSGAVDLDIGVANVFRLTMLDAITISLVGLPAPVGEIVPITLIVTNADAFAITWPAGCRFVGSEAPAPTGEAWFALTVVESQITVGLAWDNVGTP